MKKCLLKDYILKQRCLEEPYQEKNNVKLSLAFLENIRALLLLETAINSILHNLYKKTHLLIN